MSLSRNDLFDLGMLRSDYTGYWMNESGIVYSTRKYATPTLLSGTHSESGHYYTMNGRTVNAAALRSQINSNADYKRYLASRKSAKVASGHAIAASAKQTIAGQPSDRRWAHDTRHGLAEKGWVIASVKGNGNLVLGSEPKIHLTEASVKAELERLATQFKGDTFVALKIVHEVVASGISWK